MGVEHNFGKRSLYQLRRVHSDLVLLAGMALELSDVDFSVHEGARARARQRLYVAQGVSRTMDSRHLLTGDPLRAKAVDLVPYIGGKLKWEWAPIYKIANAVSFACAVEGVDLRWGGVWDRTLLQLDRDDLPGEVEAYAARRKALGLSVFLDGPHFELSRTDYP